MRTAPNGPKKEGDEGRFVMSTVGKLEKTSLELINEEGSTDMQ